MQLMQSGGVLAGWVIEIEVKSYCLLTPLTVKAS